jgi:hypothetical protein
MVGSTPASRSAFSISRSKFVVMMTRMYSSLSWQRFSLLQPESSVLHGRRVSPFQPIKIIARRRIVLKIEMITASNY